MPSFKDITDVTKLSIQLAASKMIQSGHEIIEICKKYHIPVIEDAVKNNMLREGNTLLFDRGIKKDITSSLNISVISVIFSRTKPKIIFKKLWLEKLFL